MAETTDYLNALGAGSGLDTKSIVSAMVTAETAGKQAYRRCDSRCISFSIG